MTRKAITVMQSEMTVDSMSIEKDVEPLNGIDQRAATPAGSGSSHPGLGDPGRLRIPGDSPLPRQCRRSVDEFEVESTEAETTITIETRRWRIRGLERNTIPGVMKLNIMVTNTLSERFHVDSFDLYHARGRRTFLAEAADEIGAAEPQLRGDLGRVLLKLEQLQHEQGAQRKAPAASAQTAHTGRTSRRAGAASR